MRMLFPPETPLGFEYERMQSRFISLVSALNPNTEKVELIPQAFDSEADMLAQWEKQLRRSEICDLEITHDGRVVKDGYKKILYIRSDQLFIPTNGPFHIFFDSRDGRVVSFRSEKDCFAEVHAIKPVNYNPQANYRFHGKDSNDVYAVLLGTIECYLLVEEEPNLLEP